MIELNENINHYHDVLKIMENNEFVIDRNLTSIADVSKKGGRYIIIILQKSFSKIMIEIDSKFKLLLRY